jgi:hypothetical protein
MYPAAKISSLAFIGGLSKKGTGSTVKILGNFKKKELPLKACVYSVSKQQILTECLHGLKKHPISANQQPVSCIRNPE